MNVATKEGTATLDSGSMGQQDVASSTATSSDDVYGWDEGTAKVSGEMYVATNEGAKLDGTPCAGCQVSCGEHADAKGSMQQQGVAGTEQRQHPGASRKRSSKERGSPEKDVRRSGRRATWDSLDMAAWEDKDGQFAGLRLHGILGTGSFGRVHLAETSSGKVAVKRFRASVCRNESELVRLQQELELGRQLSHPRLVRMLGTLLIDGAPALVLELMEGTLFDMLHQGSTPPVQWRAQALLEVADGLAYLHSQQLAHRDVKSVNVLLCADGHAKLADFGLMTRFSMEQHVRGEHTLGVGTVRYMAPEVLFGPYNETCDTFSFGMLMWEVIHVAKAFGEMPALAASVRLQMGERPQLASPAALCGQEVLMVRCWQHQPEQRPSMAEVLRVLQSLEPLPQV